MPTPRARRGAATTDASTERAVSGAQRPIVAMGEVISAYGVRGWVKVRPHTGDVAALLAYPTWWLRQRARSDWAPVALREGREHSGALIARIEGIDSRERATQCKGALVGVPRDELPSLGKDEVYQADLVGLDVVNRAGVRLGRVVAVEAFGAHPLIRVESDGSGERWLIPFVAAYVDGVDLAAARIDVDWEPDY